MKNINIALIFRIVFVIAIIGMIGLGLAGIFVNPPTVQDAIEMTVESGVSARSTEIALLTGTPDADEIQATVNAIIDSTMTAVVMPTATATPPPTAGEQAVSTATGFVGWVLGILLWMWNLFSFGGLWTQLCCCIGLPLLFVLSAFRDGTFG